MQQEEDMVSSCSPSQSPRRHSSAFMVVDIEAPPPQFPPPPVHQGASSMQEKSKHHDQPGKDKDDRFVPISLKFADVRFAVQLSTPAASSSGCCCFCNRLCWSKQQCSSSTNKQRSNSSSSSKAIHKQILHGVSGYVAPGEILAMMGPSGSGKTTLLNILGGRTPVQHSGSITYNDMAYTKALKRRMGFVTQDDVLFMHLTVEETLRYAALLRLPRGMTKQQKLERADNILRDLGLDKCKDTIIGGPFMRGISGGERKRVCIGQEVLIDPSILLLDEPTSGLDSTIALKIIQLIQGLAEKGRTIVTTIHQPSSRIFYMFDKLLLLSEGHTIYFGKGNEAMQYFNTIGLRSTMLVNPADFLLDLANGNINDTCVSQELDHNFQCLSSCQEYQGMGQEKLVQKYLADHFESQNSMNEILARAPVEVDQQAVSDKREWVTTWWEQFLVLTSRGFKERRHELLSWLRVLQVFLSAVIAGLIWWQSGSDNEQHLQDQLGLVFFISIYWGYFPVFMAIYTFPQERAMLTKERASDMYRLSSYFMSRTLGDLPLNLVLPFLFLVTTYFMAHMTMTVQAFVFTVLAIFLIVITAEGLGLFVGAAMMDTKHATTFASIILLTFMLTGGFFTHGMLAFMNWLKYISYTSYSYKLLLKIQYSTTQVMDCESQGGCRSIASSSVFHGEKLGVPYEEVFGLLIMSVGYRLLAYCALRKMNNG